MTQRARKKALIAAVAMIAGSAVAFRVALMFRHETASGHDIELDWGVRSCGLAGARLLA